MKRKIIFIAFIVVSLIALTVIGYKNLKVQKVDCQSQFGPCDSDIEIAISSFTGKNILEVYSGIRSQLKENIKVSEYKVKFINPTHLNVHLTQRKPQVAVTTEGEGQYYLYSVDGYLLGTATETQLPVIRLKDSSVITERQTIFVIELAYALNQTYDVNEIAIYQGGMEFVLPQFPKIIFPIDGDIDVLLGSLSFVLSQLNSQLGDFRMESVDFRFRNPVIKVQNQLTNE